MRPISTSGLPGIPLLDRRRFLSMLGSAGALSAVGCSSAPTLRLANSDRSGDHGAATIVAADSPPPPIDDEPTPGAGRSTPNGDRTLVVVELQGGNDGLATLQPIGESRLVDHRGDLLTAPDELVSVDGAFGWHPALTATAAAGLAAVVGVGSAEPDFSHFEMEQRWWRGDSRRHSRVSTGFFGRLCDQLDVGDPVTGLSLSGGPTPALAAEKAVTVGLVDPGANWIFQEDDPWLATYRRSVAAMAEPSASDSESWTAARGGLDDMTRFADSLASLDHGDDERYPWTELGQQLRFASEVIALDAGVRIIHVRLGGFDTHTGQAWRHPELLREIDDALTVFRQDLDEQGRAESTLIATTSEFGRRVEQNDGGTDHGGASTMMVCAPGLGGVHGEAPSLRALDDGNLAATARFEDYYATLAEDWFGVPADDLLPAGGERIPGLLDAVT